MNEGWVSIHRQLQDHKLWVKDPFSRGQAWIDLILLANHKDGGFWNRGVWIEVKRGQVGWSVKALAKRWQWSQGKVSRFLNFLKNEDQIEYQKSNLTTLISISKYDTYQKTERQTESKRRADGEQTETNNNDNKDNNENKSVWASAKHEELWNKFWEAGLLKVDKATAIRRWNNLSQASLIKLLTHLAHYIQTNEPRYLKRPSSYINSKVWMDNPVEVNRTPARRNKFRV